MTEVREILPNKLMMKKQILMSSVADFGGEIEKELGILVQIWKIFQPREVFPTWLHLNLAREFFHVSTIELLSHLLPLNCFLVYSLRPN